MHAGKDQKLAPFIKAEMIAVLGIAVCFVLLVTSILAPGQAQLLTLLWSGTGCFWVLPL